MDTLHQLGFTWVLRTGIQVLMLAQQTLLPREPLPQLVLEISTDAFDSVTLRPVVKVLYLEAVGDFNTQGVGVWGLKEARLCARHQDHT